MCTGASACRENKKSLAFSLELRADDRTPDRCGF